MGGFPSGRLSGYDGAPDPFREENVSRQDVGFLERENLNFGSTDEVARELPPFLATSIAKDRLRRNFYIADGGKQVFIEPGEEVPVAQTARVYDRP